MAERALLHIIPAEDLRADIQASLRNADAVLTEQDKQAYPEQPFMGVQKKLHDHWIALLPTQVDDDLGIAAGRVVASARERTALEEKLRAFRAKYPHLSLFIRFTGPSRTGKGIVIA